MDPTGKVRMLAEALARDFAQSRASAACCATLQLALPGLQYLSIAVMSPALKDTVVASANCATAGPTTLHLHDSGRSAAGAALSDGQPVRGSLSQGGAAAAGKVALTDVQQMALESWGVTDWLCVPFAGGSGGSSGALLFGFGAPPSLDSRRVAFLALLAHCLPEPLARLSGDTLAFVHFACGQRVCTRSGCCCCPEGNDSDSGTDAGPGTAAALPVGGSGSSLRRRLPRVGLGSTTSDPASSHVKPESWPTDDVGVGKLAEPGRPPGPYGVPKEVPKAVLAAAAAAAAGAGPSFLQREQPAGGWADHTALPPRRPVPTLRLSKELLAAVADSSGGGSADSLHQSPLTLRFTSPVVEHEYAAWVSRSCSRVAFLTSVMLVLSLSYLMPFEPHHLLSPGVPGVMAAVLGLPLALLCLHKWIYATWTEQVLITYRIFCAATTPLEQLSVPFSLSGATGLLVAGLLCPVRFHLHLVLQLLLVGAAALRLSKMSADCSSKDACDVWLGQEALAVVGLGYVLPTLVLRYSEQRSRAAFARLLQAASCRRRGDVTLGCHG